MLSRETFQEKFYPAADSTKRCDKEAIRQAEQLLKGTFVFLGYSEEDVSDEICRVGCYLKEQGVRLIIARMEGETSVEYMTTVVPQNTILGKYGFTWADTGAPVNHGVQNIWRPTSEALKAA